MFSWAPLAEADNTEHNSPAFVPPSRASATLRLGCFILDTFIRLERTNCVVHEAAIREGVVSHGLEHLEFGIMVCPQHGILFRLYNFVNGSHCCHGGWNVGICFCSSSGENGCASQDRLLFTRECDGDTQSVRLRA